LITALPGGLFKNAATNLGNSQRCDEQVSVDLVAHPGQKRFGRLWLGNVAEDVGVE
jgi:signal recognition particle receptor subunit beta